MLNSFQHLFCIRFRNPLELLFHLPLIKQYLIVLFGRVQSLILFALQILFAMLRATSSFGLRPHTLSQNNTQLFCSAEYKIRKFGMTQYGITSLFCGLGLFGISQQKRGSAPSYWLMPYQKFALRSKK